MRRSIFAFAIILILKLRSKAKGNWYDVEMLGEREEQINRWTDRQTDRQTDKFTDFSITKQLLFVSN
jgi:hypothetical protein